MLPIINNNNKEIFNFDIKKIFNSRELFINNFDLSNKYIQFIRSFSEKDETKNLKNISNREIIIDINYFKKRENINNFSYFAKLCSEEKLLEPIKNNISEINFPLISIILPSFNKEKVIMKSIRSIQNQSFKNIEIIIVDDCSTDNSNKYYQYLLKTDHRIRIFKHLKNMGVWRSRLDGFLYSRGKYVIHFDTGDLYSDRFVLEDAYNLIEKYNLDSIKMLFRLIFSFEDFNNTQIPLVINSNYTKIVYGSENIKKYNEEIFSTWGNIWNRLTRADIVTKGLNLLNKYLINAYKNIWDDIWWNKLINEVSNNLLIINRIGYLYYKDGNGEGDIIANSDIKKDKIIHEFIYFLYFDYKILPNIKNKESINKKLINCVNIQTIKIKRKHSICKHLNYLNIFLIISNFKVLINVIQKIN